MFFVLNLTQEIQLEPRYFGRNIKATLLQRLEDKVEGTCSGKYGFVICVLALSETGKGLIQPGTGWAVFNVQYQCLVFRPFKGEVLDAVVRNVNKMGFFADAGPLQIFVSNHLIPDDFEFVGEDEPCYVSADGTQKIQENVNVRVKIVGSRVDQQDIFCVGTIKEDYLGVILGGSAQPLVLTADLTAAMETDI